VDLETYFSDSQKETSLSNIEKELIDEKPIEKESMEEELNTIFSITVQNPALWSPDHPELYQLTLKLHGVDQDKDIRFGIRTISKTASQIMLNGDPIRINGISFPEELLPDGRNYPIQQRRREVLDLKALGINVIHTPYLPHNKSLVKVADEEGILLIEEVPLNKYSHFAEKGDLINGMVENLILRDFNNPSVIIWSLGENIPVYKSETANLINAVIKNSKVLDSSRLFTYFSNHLYVDKCRKNLDLVIFNLPHNLHKKQIEKIYKILNKVRRKNRHLPIILAGFSQEAQYGIRSADAKPFSEDYQLYKTLPYLKLANSIPFITGWIFSSYRDYRSVLYTKKHQQNGFARYGLYDELNRPKLIYNSLGNIIDNKFDTEFPKVKFLWIKMKISQFFERLSLKFHPIKQKRLEKKIYSYYFKAKH
ncbi:MAG: glycoside hydrolase family 2 TIM barrel-domain containing protein, partial [Promethearchaeota archaeon]